MEQKLPEEDAIRQYLLGKLDGPELGEIEEKLLSSEELSETADVVEDEIIEDYLNDELGERDKKAVEIHFLRPAQRRQKMRVARMLKRRLEAQSGQLVGNAALVEPRPIPPRRSFWLYGGIAVTVLMGALSLDLAITQKDLKEALTSTRSAQAILQAQLTQERERSASLETRLKALEQSPITLDLQPGISRDSGGVPEIALRPTPQPLKLELLLTPNVASSSYHVRVLSRGREVWSQAGLKPVVSPSMSTLVFEVPVRPGAYDIIVTSETNPSARIVYPFNAKLAQ